MAAPFFELRGISKYFSKVVANKDVDLSVDRGEVVALLGENGAGKSTLMKILYGLYRADEGEILLDGEVQKIDSPKDAMALGISMIQQHFSLVHAHTVMENIILGTVKGTINYQKYEQEISTLARQYEFNLDINAKIRDLSVGEQQKVEILKALYLKAKLLIMDEPTAVLTPQEIGSLMEFVKGYAARGNAVVFITHKLKEVMEVADRIVVMRNGQKYGDVKKADTNEKDLSRLMIGRDITPPADADRKPPTVTPGLVLEKVTVQGPDAVPLLEDISFTVYQGEILGVAGVSGNGQQELCEAICGALPLSGGAIHLDGEDITSLPISERIKRGIGYLVSDRHKEGLVMDMTIAENMIQKTSNDKRWKSTVLPKALRFFSFLDSKKIDAHTAKAITEYAVKAPGPGAYAKGLSGGNQQKVVVAREVDCGKKLIIFDQPTRGLDLGAIDNVHKAILAERAAGKSILLVSTELSEIFTLSDRVAVIFKGKIRGIYDKQELTAEKIGLMMAGYKAGESAA